MAESRRRRYKLIVAEKLKNEHEHDDTRKCERHNGWFKAVRLGSANIKMVKKWDWNIIFIQNNYVTLTYENKALRSHRII
jgi:hypothetical protein